MIRIPSFSCAPLFALVLLAQPGSVLAQLIPTESLRAAQQFEEDYDNKKWEEVTAQLPAPPKMDALIPIYISAATEHSFLIDPGSVSIGKDGVVRYTLVIRASGGATNISFEGMRCETRERRFYAFGHSGSSWSKARSNAWTKIREEAANRHHAALFTDFFCPNGVIAGKESDILYSLRHQSGGAPRVVIGR